MRVTVIPVDRYISVDGEGLFFDFHAPAGVRAIQWDGDAGQIEQDESATPIADVSLVQPYVTLWQAEKDRIAALPPPPPPPPAHMVDPASIIKRLQPYGPQLKAAIEADAGMWMLWQRMAVRAKPIDMDDPEFPQAWAALGAIIGPAGGDPDAILAALKAEDAF